MEFFVDHMLGRLCRWLRIMGFDAEYAPIDMDDSMIAKICSSNGRVLVTRDKALSNRVPGSVFIESQNHIEQTKQFVSLFHPDPEKLFSRCTKCNGILQETKVTPELSLPPRVMARFETVFKCAVCGKMFWKGDHYHKIMQRLSEMVVTDAGTSKE